MYQTTSAMVSSYDKNGLPEDFADFAETLFDFIRFYGLGGILDPSVYGKVKCHKYSASNFGSVDVYGL